MRNSKKPVADTTKIPQDKVSVRTREAVLRGDPPNTYTPPGKGQSKGKM